VAGTTTSRVTYGFSEVATGVFARTTTESLRILADGTRIVTHTRYTNTRLGQ
jgi:hypothetical protein